jgi:Lon protease-like protein
MSELLPIFPLPNVVLFPNVFLPLHIFEPRYREMVADALNGDRLIGMTLLKPGWERDYEGRPPIYPIGCSGVITHYERLSDGRFNIMLRGVERFRVASEDHSKSYRRAIVDAYPDAPMAGGDCARLRETCGRLTALIAQGSDRTAEQSALGAAMNDGDLVHALAQYLDLDALEKQALLEQRSVLSRGEALAELLEMKVFAARSGGGSPLAH